MRSTLFAGVCVLAAAAPAARGQDYGVGPHTYYLHGPSSYQQGCWGPCACALSNHETMLGTLTLSLITVGDATDLYSVSNVNWSVPTLGGQPFNLSLTGSGTLGAGQHPFVSHQYMQLDLTLAPAVAPWPAEQQFDVTPGAFTRSVAPPVLDIEIANTTGCPGIRLRVVATRCRADWNASGVLETADILGYINGWFAQDPRADFDAGGLSIHDVFGFVNSWFGGCN